MAAEMHVLHTPSTAAQLPSDWSWKRLDAVCQGVFDCPHSTPVLSEDGPYLARSQDVRSGVFRTDEAARVSEATYNERIARAEPRHGDLLYSREGTYFGIAAEVPAGVRVCLGQRMVLIRPSPSAVSFRFLRYWLNSPVMALHTGGHRDGSVAERLNLPTIRALPVAVPPLPEQRAIAHILGTLDDKIELNRRMNETLETMARALFKSWFVDFDPVRAKAEGRDPGLPKPIADLFPDRFEDSELGEIPAGWGVGAVESLCESITSGGTPARMNSFFWSDGTIPWFKTGELLDGPLIESEEHITEAAVAGSSCKLWPAGTILFALYASPTVGRLGVLTRPGTSNQAAAGLIAKPEVGVPFLRRLLLEARVRLQTIAVGAAQQNINQGVLKSHRAVIPNADVAGTYSRSVSSLDEQQGALSKQAHTLAALRDALLPKLISGELRVRDAERMVDAAS